MGPQVDLDKEEEMGNNTILNDTGKYTPNKQTPKTKNSNMTGSRIDLAKEERTGNYLFDKTVRLEQRAKLLKSLGKWGLGTNRMEHNQLRSRRELTVDTGRRVKDLVEEINLKTKDAERAAEVARRERNKWKEKVEKCGDLEKNVKRNLLNKMGKNARKTRETVKLKNEKAV